MGWVITHLEPYAPIYSNCNGSAEIKVEPSEIGCVAQFEHCRASAELKMRSGNRRSKQIQTKRFDGIEHELDGDRGQQQSHDADGDAHHDRA